jgi:hypothetical protein
VTRGALVVLPAALLATACFEGQRTICVKADGSGAVVDTLVLGAQMKAMMDAAEAGADAAAKQKAKYEAAAAAMGPGVRFVGEEKTAQGLKATFAFTDIRTVKLDAAPGPAGDDEGGKKGQPLTFTFARQGARSVLTVIQPRPPAKEPSAAVASPDPMAQMASAMWTMMKPMLKGLKLRTVLEVEGTIAKTNSRLRSGSAVTLLEMDFDEIAADDGNFRKFASAGDDPSTLDPRLLQGVKGIKVNPEPEVVVEFGAK